MEDKILSVTHNIEKKRKKRKIWKSIFTTLAAIVVFCTTYALILPAITKERTSYCGHEAHAHEEACYEERLICMLSEKVPIAEPEVEYHTHEETCYQEKTDLICTIVEEEGHIHSDECKEIVPVNQCGLEENEEHTHTEECFIEAATIVCGLEETAATHVHEEACYQTTTVLVCEKEEVALPDVHVHGEECYETVLICEKEEHAHELLCYSNPNADVETEEDWEATIPKELTGVWSDDLLVVAKSQLGYQESTKNYVVVEEEETKGYTRYGDWYGDAYGDWCAMFASFCLNYAEIPENVLGYEANCQKWVEKLQERDLEAEETKTEDQEEPDKLYQFSGTYIPKPGDLVFFEVSVENQANHIGIVSEVILTEEDSSEDDEDKEKSIGQIKTVEGNASDAVSERTYQLEDESILGYAVLPENPDYVPPVGADEELSTEFTEDGTTEENLENIDASTETTEETAETTEPEGETAVEEEILITRQTINAVIYTDETMQQIAEDDTTVITITGLLPEKITARAYPVVLEEPVIDGKSVVLAYDITLYDKEGNLIANENSEYPITVTIEPGEWPENDEGAANPEDYQIYYVPEEGEPEAMETEGSENEVSFTTNHFSVYALTVTGTNEAVYLNGTSGNDSNSGTSSNAAVKTLEKALSLVKQGGTIYITGTVTVSNSQEWNLEGQGITLKRGSSLLSDPLIEITNGGSLTLANITVHGGCGTPSTSNIASTTTYATYNNTKSSYVSAPLIHVNSGGSLTITDGAILEYNSNKSSSVSTSGDVGQGGAVYCQGNLTMSGGTVQYCEALSGGGIYIESTASDGITFHLSGGTIQYNYAREIISTSASRKNPYHKNAGGGVYVGDYVTMNMSGGLVAYNQTSREGGGISLGWLDRSNGAAINDYITTFNMTGGTFIGNIATSTGGGLNITAGRQAFISAGTFTENTANGKEYQPDSGYSAPASVYSGGAIYLDAQQKNNSGNYAGKPGYAVINRVLIANNEAGYYGGGIACCSTSKSSINSSVDLKNGTAIYNNTAKESGNEMHLSGTVLDIGDTVLGGGAYGWSKNGNAYDNNLSDNSAAIVEAKKLATVIITDNYALDGGGIGCNGQIEIGGESETESISITKIWDDDGKGEHPEYITVQIYQDGQAYGDPIEIRRIINDDGTETWPVYYVDGLPSGHTYTIKEIEVDGYESTVEQNEQSFTIINKLTGYQVVKKWFTEDGIEITEGLPDFITVQLYQNGIEYGESVQLNLNNEWSYFWTDLPEKDGNGEDYSYTVKELNIPEGFYSTGESITDETGVMVITNIKVPTTTVSVEKIWASGTPGKDSIELQLYADGEIYGDRITLSADINWFYKWENLPKLNSSGKEIIYEVKEIPIAGFDSSIKVAAPGDVKKSWTPVSTLESGKTYMLVTANGALTGTNSGLSWTDVSAHISAGTTPPASTLWTYDGKLKSGESVYLKTDNRGSFFSPTYVFTTGTSGSNITYNNRYLSATAGILSTKYYFGTISDSYASAVNETSSAAVFTPYVMTDSSGQWGEQHFIVTNTQKEQEVELPETGSMGSGPYMVIGTVLFAVVSLFLLYYDKIREYF